MRTWLSKIPTVLVAILSALALYLYVNNTTLEREVIRQDTKITTLENNLVTEQRRVEVLTELSRQLDETLVELEGKRKQADNDKELALKELETVNRKGTTNESHKANSTSLDNPPLNPDVTRVLSDLCRQVRGSPCPNP